MSVTTSSKLFRQTKISQIQLQFEHYAKSKQLNIHKTNGIDYELITNIAWEAWLAAYQLQERTIQFCATRLKARED